MQVFTFTNLLSPSVVRITERTAFSFSCLVTFFIATLFVLFTLTGCTRSTHSPTPHQSELSVSNTLNSTQTQDTLDDLLANLDPTIFDTPDTFVPSEQLLKILPVAVQQQNWRVAKALIERADVPKLTIDEYGQFIIWKLRYFNLSRNFHAANQQLNNYRLNTKLPLMKVADQIAISLARAETYYGLSRYLASAKERIFIEGLIDDEQLQQSNIDTLWATLLEISPQQLQVSLNKASHKNERRWLELALIYLGENASINDKKNQLHEWQARWQTKLTSSFFTFGKSPANQLVLPPVESLLKSDETQYQTIAIFLPLSGRLDNLGKAVRDGIIHNHLAQHQFRAQIANNKRASADKKKPSLLFFDTHKKTISTLYNEAINSGADIIIGPLEKSKVAELFTMPTDIPVLTLNFINDELPPPINVIQFGLAVEDEATQLAKLAKQSQSQHILLFNIDKDWAVRAGNTFDMAWQTDKNHTLSRKTLSVRENFSKEIAESLLLSESNARLSAIENALSQRLFFTPRRRRDIDLIVLFANEKSAKTIKPLLAYHYAGDITVIANSNVYDGTNRPAQNKDIEGTVFNEMPWIINPQKSNVRTRQSKILERLYAMGIDAYSLHSKLDYLKINSANRIAGNTGYLSMSKNRIFRELLYAHINNGKATPIDPSTLLAADQQSR